MPHSGTDEIRRVLDETYEEGRIAGRKESDLGSRGQEGAALAARVIAGACEQAAGALASLNPEEAQFFTDKAEEMRDFLTGPTIGAYEPRDNAKGISPLNPVSVSFNSPIRAETLTEETFYLGAATGGPHLRGTLVYDEESRVATLTPEGELSPGVRYRVTIDGVKSRGGRALAEPHTFEFETAE